MKKTKVFVFSLLSSLVLLLTVSVADSEAQRFGRGRMPDRANLQKGDIAPDFKLKTSDGKHQVQLSNYRNKKAVVLIFGSYT